MCPFNDWLCCAARAHAQVMGSIANSRSVSQAEVRAGLDDAPLLPQVALQMRLLDGAKYRCALGLDL